MAHTREPKTPIALVGVGCILPDALSPDAFWTNALAGRSALRPLTGGAWEWEKLGLPPAAAARVEGFAPDWRALRMPPADVAAMNPAQLQVLEAGRQALAGVQAIPRERTGVWLGATGLGWRPDTGARVRLDDLSDAVRGAASSEGVAPGVAEEALASARAALEGRLLPASEEPVVNSAASIAAGRIAMLLDLRGPHCAIDAGYASGLAALDCAVRALRDFTVDCAVFGAASELLSPAELVAMSRMGVLARERVRPFDAEAQGTLPGEGAVLFAAKRLEDALRDGDRIHAVVLGVGAAADGKATSILAPRHEGLALAMRRALADAAVDAGTVGFVECHATGTPRGDATEVRATVEVYGGAPAPVWLGSAKPLVGHLRGGAGAVGLLRAVLALERGQVPAQAGFSRPSPDLALDGGAVAVPTETRPLAPAAGAPAARAAVTSRSLGCLAYHAVLEAHVPARPVRAARSPRDVKREPIAVVGLGGVFPGSAGVGPFWQALLDGRGEIREVPAERWDASRYCHPDPARLERSYTRLGAFVEPGTAEGRWRIPPASVEAIDPAHLLVLRAAEEAFEDAGLGRAEWDPARAGVYLGFMACQGRKLLAEVRYHFERLAAELAPALLARGLPEGAVQRLLSAARRRVEDGLPPLGEDALPGWLGSVAAARVARRFDLRGPQLAVESACASTLAALQQAVQALRDGTCDTAFAGGVWADMQPEFYVGSCRFNALSATGSTPFDARANGFVPGEGAGLLILRRLADAERAGQRIHAVIRGVAGSSDGKGKSVFAPSRQGEALAIRRAIEDSELDPALVEYVECHGTGTALGDKTEIEACLDAYGRSRPRPLRVGSVKSNIGHLLAGAGAPALLKAVLAVREGVIPPSLSVEKPNPAIDFQAGPVEVVTRAHRWEAPAGEPRRAGVSGFGLGGTNLHAIVEEYRGPAVARVTPGAPAAKPSPAAVAPLAAAPAASAPLAIAAAGGKDARECLERLRALADGVRGASGADYLAALASGRGDAAGAPYRAAVVARDPVALDAKLALLARGVAGELDPSVLQKQGVYAGAPGAGTPAAVTFPGQGPQYPNMLRDALAAFPSIGATLDRADRAYEALCGRTIRAAFFSDDPDAYTQSDEDIHCAVFVVNVALHDLLARHGVAPRALMGQSAGELAALVAARALSLEDGLAAMRERTLAVLALQSDDPGKMVALACGAERLERLLARLPGFAALAADNGPDACIVSGDARAIPELLRRAAGEGIEANLLAVSHGYHSELIGGARPRYLRLLRTLTFRAPEVEVISTVTGRSLAEVLPERFPEHLASQFVEPVRLRPAVEALHARGVGLYVECGPKWPLTTFVGQILRDRPHVALATIHPKVGEVEQLQRALACLFVHGAANLHEDPSMSDPHVRPESTPAPRPAAVCPAAPQDVTSLLRAVRDLIDGYLEAQAAGGVEPAVPAAPARGHARPEVAAGHAEAPAGAVALAHEVPTRPAPAAAPAADLAARVRRALLDEYVRRTGYPEEMLDADLDLEAELGIDTVKQVAVLAAVREKFGLPPDPAFKLRDANTIRKAVAWFERRLAAASEPAPAAAPAPVPRVEPAARPAPAPGAALEAAREQVRRAMLDELVRRTGYPEEMLDADLDLEAELGIDTVKQVAVLAAVREKFGLQPDPGFKLRDANTIRKAVEVLACRVAGEPSGPKDPPGGPRPPSGGGAPAPRAEGAGHAATSASPTVHASGRLDVPTARRLLEAMLAAAPGTGVRELSNVELRIAGDTPPDRDPLVDLAPIGAAGAVKLRALLGEDSADALVHTGDPRGAAPAPSEILRAIAPDRRERAVSGPELREALAPTLGSAQGVLSWARSDGFMVAAGGATLPAGDAARRLAAVLASAGELAEFAWLGVTGAPHAVCSLDRATVHRLPAEGEELALHVKMVAPESGLWRADVTVVCGTTLAVEIRGLCGHPVASTAAAGPIGEAAERAFRRYSRRIHGGRASEGVA